MPILPLLLAIAITEPCSQILTLRTGHEIIACGAIKSSGDRVIFSGVDGKLYSLPSDEITVVRSEARDEVVTPDATPQAASSRPLNVSEVEKNQLLARLAKSRGIRRAPAPLRDLSEPSADREIEVAEASDERYWRERSRVLDEQLRRAREELDLLLRREQKLEDELLGLRALGFKDHQFSYQIFQLQFTRDSMDRAQLEIVRAERGQFQFREDARKEGILPGWLR